MIRGSTNAMLSGVAAIAVLALACDGREPTTPSPGIPGDDWGALFAEDKDKDPHPPADQGRHWMTGGGRIDCQGDPGRANPCPPKRSTPQSRAFQTFGFNFGDKKGDGTVDGELQHVDHRDDMRINESPRNYHSVSWDKYKPEDPGKWCEGGGGDGAARAFGKIERKNDGTIWKFEVFALDCGEPGTRHPHDRYGIQIDDGYRVYGKLTGGNIQAHIKEAGPGRPSGEASGAQANTGASGSQGPTPHASFANSGFDEASAPSLNLADLVRAENAFAVAAGGASGDHVSAQSISTLQGVNVLNGLITADQVTAIATSSLDAVTGSSHRNAAGSQFSNLVVNGIPIDGDAGAIAVVDGRVWVGTLQGTRGGTRVTVLETDGSLATTVPVPGAPAQIAAAPGGGAWLTFGTTDTLYPAAVRLASQP
jgi:hypothetical protein